ncbi:CPBP family intramembrane metalloprotease [Nocardiopsis dassonvillei]|uniref:CPBP family intramembrane glutamic endopeptidase n=1 Tax=Nocardiopsis dassonvillei TaxID=2014 RepID=UPI0020A3A4A2|nr:type II CAAX endopeptidase family protein [Nocardiopsis dassonvillei]MCP3012142.1 CPBP family intramembrane metalloprotease [Nocardiopsis dassonvillei]
MHSNDGRSPRSPLPHTEAPFPAPTNAGGAQAPARTPSGPAAPHPRRRGPRPAPPGVEYHRVLAGDRRRIGRGVLAIALLVAGLFASNIVLAVAAAFADSLMGRTNPTFGGTDYTPLFLAANLVSIALLIPWSMMLQRWLYGVRGPSLHSVLSSFRFDLLGRALLFIGPLWLVLSLIGPAVMPLREVHWSTATLLTVFAVNLLLTPLQAAGEEYGFRGLVFRVAGSWGRGPRTALFLGVLVSSLAFTAVHISTDPWFNLWCLTLSVSLAVVTWRTGGIEIAVAVHALHNTLAALVLTVLHADPNPALDRSAGTGSAAVAVLCVGVAVVAAVVWWRTRGTGPALTPSGQRPARV